MRLRVDHEPIQYGGDQLVIIGEEQKQILKRFAGPEALLKVQRFDVVLVGHVVDGRVAAALDSTELDPGVQYLATLLPIGLLLGHVVQIEQRLDVFRPQQIVSIVRMNVQLWVQVLQLEVGSVRRKEIQLEILLQRLGVTEIRTFRVADRSRWCCG